MAAKTQPKTMFTVRETAAILSVCMKTVRDYITKKKLRAVRRGGGNYLIRATDLRAFLGLDPDETLTCSVGDEP